MSSRGDEEAWANRAELEREVGEPETCIYIVPPCHPPASCLRLACLPQFHIPTAFGRVIPEFRTGQGH